MDEITGDGPRIVPLGGSTDAAASGGTGSTTEQATGGGPRPPRDPFARSRFLPSKRVAIVVGLAVLVIAGGSLGTVTAIRQSNERRDAKQVADYESAVLVGHTAMAGYTFPASTQIRPRTFRCFVNAVCGTTDASPQDALTKVAESLTARGVTLTDTACTKEGRPHVKERCSASMRVAGKEIGQVRATLDPTLRDAFGAPTTVWVDLDSVDTGGTWVDTPAPAMPSDPTRVTVLPPDLMAAAKCTKKAAEGCLVYTIDTGIDAGPGATWKRAGHYAVDHEWLADGDCPLGLEHSCTFQASRETDDGGVTMTATFRPMPTELEVHAEITALGGSVQYGQPPTTQGHPGHNGT